VKYEWAISKTWSEEFGGHTEINECTSERDAREKVADWERVRNRPGRVRLTDMHVLRRPVGDWERV